MAGAEAHFILVLAKVIADLTDLLNGLDEVYPADQSRGRCLGDR